MYCEEVGSTISTAKLVYCEEVGSTLSTAELVYCEEVGSTLSTAELVCVLMTAERLAYVLGLGDGGSSSTAFMM